MIKIILWYKSCESIFCWHQYLATQSHVSGDLDAVIDAFSLLHIFSHYSTQKTCSKMSSATQIQPKFSKPPGWPDPHRRGVLAAHCSWEFSVPYLDQAPIRWEPEIKYQLPNYKDKISFPDWQLPITFKSKIELNGIISLKKLEPP